MNKQLEHALNQIERAAGEMWSRAPAVLDRNERGGSAQRDGFGASSLGGGSPASILHCDAHGRDNCPCGQNVPVDVSSDPTGNAASADPTKDPLDTIARSIGHHMNEAVLHLQAALSAVALGEHLANPDRRGNPPTHCQACARLVMCTANDRIRAGYCASCAEAWRRYQQAEQEQGREADRVLFETARKRETAA